MPPRIIYVTSSQGKPSSLSSPPSSDPQLLNAKDSYGASKYIGSIVTSRLDWELSQQGDDDEIRQITGSAGRDVCAVVAVNHGVDDGGHVLHRKSRRLGQQTDHRFCRKLMLVFYHRHDGPDRDPM
jgi:hypothetical protein